MSDEHKDSQSHRQARWQSAAHAAHYAGLSQEKLAAAFGLTFQQVQKYEKGMNRISASRLQQAAHILDVSVPFFFEGAPGGHTLVGNAPSSAYVYEFVSSPEGLSLVKAIMRIARPGCAIGSLTLCRRSPQPMAIKPVKGSACSRAKRRKK